MLQLPVAIDLASVLTACVVALCLMLGRGVVRLVLSTRPRAGAYCPPVRPGLLGLIRQQSGKFAASPAGAPLIEFLKEAEQGGFGVAYYSVAPGRPRVMLANTKDMEHVLTTNVTNYIKGREYELLGDIAGKQGLVTIRNESVHTQQRRLVSAAFNPSTLTTIADAIVSYHLTHLYESLLKKAGAEQLAFTLDGLLYTFTLNVVAHAAFRDLQIGGTDVAKEFSSVFRGASRISFLRYLFPSLVGSGVKTAVRRLRAAASQLIDRAESRQRTDANHSGRKLLVDCLLSDPGLSRENIVDHSLTFLFAGHDTSSKALHWTAYLLARHQNVQQTLFEELASEFGIDKMPSLATVKNCKFLYNVVREGLRYHPPVPLVLREAVHDDRLPSGFRIRRGDTVVVPIIAIHHSEQLWGADVEEYRPDRWDDPTLADRLGPCGFMPFITGKRNCIGKEFAMNEIRMAAAVLVRRFRLTLPDDEPVPERTMSVTMRPKTPVRFLLSRR